MWRFPFRFSVVLVSLLVFFSLSPLNAASVSRLRSELIKAIHDDDIDQVKDTIGKLVAQGDLKSAEALFKVALPSKLDVDPEMFEELLKGLAAFTGDDVLAFYEKQLKSRSLAARVLVIDAAARMTGETGISLIVKGLKDKTSSVVEAALAATLKRKPKEAVPVLIDLVTEGFEKKVKDAVYYHIKDTLIRLTGEDLTSPADWKKWWELRKDSFDPKKIKKGKRTVRKPVLGGKDDPTFFGVPVSSKNAVFVIDTSLSMQLVQKDDIPGLTRVSGVDRTKVVEKAKEKLTPENARLAKFWTRIEMAKRHLSKVLKGLKPPTKFNVIAFNSRVIRFQKRSQRVSSSTKRKALRWVKGLRPQGNTDTLAALKEAFKSDTRLNTIYFLSDGLPSKDGKSEDDRTAILKELLKMNRFRKIRIHTFGFYPFTMAGQPYEQLRRANEFLKEIAKKTGGTFTEMKVDPNEKPPPDFH